jgi:hypothetical protein
MHIAPAVLCFYCAGLWQTILESITGRYGLLLAVVLMSAVTFGAGCWLAADALAHKPSARATLSQGGRALLTQYNTPIQTPEGMTEFRK